MKLKVDSKKQFLGRMARKHKVSITGYPLSYYKDDKWIYLTQCGLMFGSDARKKALLKDIRKQKDFVKIDIKNDFAILITKQPLFTEPFWSPHIIRPSPVIINWKENKHTWHMASFEKKYLMDIFNLAKKNLGAKMLQLQQEKISNISIVHVLPKITKRQKMALDIAINNGYYAYPKKVKLEQLAKIMGISYSTYQQHLKKAEGALLPEVYKEL